MKDNIHISKYYSVLKKNKTSSKNSVQCILCPNKCIITASNLGVCKVRKNIDGKLYTLVYGRPCSMHVDPIEKKPLYHYLPGEKILSVGTFGCNFSCKGCQNFDISKEFNISSINEIKEVSPKDIVQLAIKNNIKMIAYTYNEPTIFFEYMLDIAKLAKKKGIKNILVSNGYICIEPLKELCKYIDAANIDLKGIDDEMYKKYCDARLEPVLETIKYLHKKGVWLELTNLVIPGLNDDKEYIEKLCEWIKNNLGTEVPLHFSRFYPYYLVREKNVTFEQTLCMAKVIAQKQGIKYVYIGNLGVIEDTYCYNCKKKVISRGSSSEKLQIIDNKCAGCDKKISGVFKT